MRVVIRTDKPLTLERLLTPWSKRFTPRSRRTESEALLKRIREKADQFRTGGDADHWLAEEAALESIVEYEVTDNVRIWVESLYVPRELPASYMTLFTGWKVRSCDIAVALFSPLAMLWLEACGARQLAELSGTIKRVEQGGEIALIDLAEEEGIPVVREQNQHDDEHIDEGMILLQANLDDSSPEWLGYVMERLLLVGANDVNLLPMTMKKSRPGVMLQVLCYQSQLEMLKTILFQETTTFGLRYFPVHCHRLARRFVTVSTEWGEVSVKVGYHRGERVQISPEYAVCAQLAQEARISLQRVYLEAVMLATKLAPSKIE